MKEKMKRATAEEEIIYTPVAQETKEIRDQVVGIKFSKAEKNDFHVLCRIMGDTMSTVGYRAIMEVIEKNRAEIEKYKATFPE